MVVNLLLDLQLPVPITTKVVSRSRRGVHDALCDKVCQ